MEKATGLSRAKWYHQSRWLSRWYCGHLISRQPHWLVHTPIGTWYHVSPVSTETESQRDRETDKQTTLPTETQTHHDPSYHLLIIHVMPWPCCQLWTTWSIKHSQLSFQEGNALIIASDGLWDAFSDDDAGEDCPVAVTASISWGDDSLRENQSNLVLKRKQKEFISRSDRHSEKPHTLRVGILI